MFCGLLIELPGIVFLANEKQHIVGFMRMKSCQGRKLPRSPKTQLMNTILAGARLYGMRSGVVTIYKNSIGIWGRLV